MKIQDSSVDAVPLGMAGRGGQREVEVAGWDTGRRRRGEAGPTGGCWLLAGGTREEQESVSKAQVQMTSRQLEVLAQSSEAGSGPEVRP